MGRVKYVHPKCFYEEKDPVLPKLQGAAHSQLPVCGNHIVGEHIRLEE